MTHVDLNAVAAGADAAIVALIARGKELFAAKFTEADGRGRPWATQAINPTKRKRGLTANFQRAGGPDASACSSCHNEPFPGGAGDFVANVFVSEGFESADFDSLDPSFSSERNTKSLFGDGLVELLTPEMTADLQALCADTVHQAWATGKDVDVKLMTKGVSFGWLTIKANGLADLLRLEGIDNDHADGNWIEVRLKDNGSNIDAAGAKINIKTGTKVQTRNVSVGGGHASGHTGWVHVGLGTAECAEIRVTWPDGEQSAPYRVLAGQFVVVARGAKGAAYWYAGR